MNSYGLLDINGIEIYHEDHGQGTPLLLLHGNSEDSTIFEDQIVHFSRHFRVITLDSRGHGKSTRNVTDISYEAMANDVLRVLDVMNITRCHIIGFSDGGIIALLLAMRAPERIISMITIGANYRTNGVRAGDRLGIRWMYCCYAIIALFSKKYNLHKRFMGLMLKEPHLDENELAEIPVPTLVVAGSHDMIRLAHTRRLAAILPKGQMEIIPECSHFVLRDQPGTFNKMALDFFYSFA